MTVTWDPLKRRENLRRHGIDFADLPPFFDDVLLERLDTRDDYGEERWQAMGLLNGLELLVVYTAADAETRHVISARRATPRERRLYWEARARY